jgi:YjbE family integral membrane protein
MAASMIADAGSFLNFEQLAEGLGLSSYGLSVLKIIGVDIVLAGDNAVVIALACRTLPPRQRVVGIILGAAAAVIMRIGFTLAVGSLLGVPILAMAGGLILFWIAVKLLLAEEASEDSARSGETLWDAVKTIAIADAVMSLDNVLAIAGAAKGDWSLIVMGLLISIPLVVGGSTLIMALLSRFPMLIWGGAALLGWIAGELIVGEKVLQPYVTTITDNLGINFHTFEFWCATVGASFVIAVGLLVMRARSGAHHGGPD